MTDATPTVDNIGGQNGWHARAAIASALADALDAGEVYL